MQRLRATILKHRHRFVALLMLALFVKAVIPAGFMISPSKDLVLKVSICADATGGLRQMEMVVPAKARGSSPERSAAKDGQCAYSGLAHAALGGIDPVLLALAFVFILVLGLAPVRRLPFGPFAHLRPPLRGPPAAA